MLSYCLKCKEKINIKNLSFLKTKNGRIMLSSNCVVRDGKRSRFIKEQGVSRFTEVLNNLFTLPSRNIKNVIS